MFYILNKKLVILLHGKSVLSGELKKIKESYQKKNIVISGDDVSRSDFKDINGVLEVNEEANDIVVKIASKEVVPLVFKAISKKHNITKFVVEEPSLNEIFIEKVGESYDK